MMQTLGAIGTAVLPSLISFAKDAATSYFTETLGSVAAQAPRTMGHVSDVVYDTMGNLRDLSKDPVRYEKICGKKLHKKERRQRYDYDSEPVGYVRKKRRNNNDYEAQWEDVEE